MARLTPEAWVAKMNKNIKLLSQQKKEYQLSCYRLLTIADKRIFDRGQDNTGAPIGTYSANELYVNTSKGPSRKKVAPKGKDKSSTSKFKNGKPRKSTHFINYQAYKQSQGMAQLGNKVNLQITKAFRRGFLTKSFPITIQGSTIIVSFGVRPTANNPEGKIEGLMVDKYPQAFKFTREERAFIIDEIRDIFINTMNK